MVKATVLRSDTLLGTWSGDVRWLVGAALSSRDATLQPAEIYTEISPDS